MTATRSSFAPAFAPKIWTDGRWLFAEFPSIGPKDGFIVKYEKTDGGLAKILALTPTIVGQPGYVNPVQEVATKLMKDKILTSAPAGMTKYQARQRHLRSIPQSIKDAAEALVDKLKK